MTESKRIMITLRCDHCETSLEHKANVTVDARNGKAYCGDACQREDARGSGQFNEAKMGMKL